MPCPFPLWQPKRHENCKHRTATCSYPSSSIYSVRPGKRAGAGRSRRHNHRCRPRGNSGTKRHCLTAGAARRVDRTRGTGRYRTMKAHCSDIARCRIDGDGGCSGISFCNRQSSCRQGVGRHSRCCAHRQRGRTGGTVVGRRARCVRSVSWSVRQILYQLR